MEKDKLLEAAFIVSRASHPVFFTGAGLSVESGVPPFRGENGLWNKYDPDTFIGWSTEQRKRNISRVVNNMRFLIPPWVNVPHLASHVLALAMRRLPDDWRTKYGFEPVLVETFVEQNRFKGTCYKAANFQCVGSTTGRTRQDRDHKLTVPIKDIYLYPLCRDFKKTLCMEAQ